MPDTVICAPVRTAVGRYGGVFKDVQATALGAAVISAVVKRTGVDPELIDDVIFGQCYPNGEAPAIGRVAALDAGLPVEVPGAPAGPPLRLRPAGGDLTPPCRSRPGPATSCSPAGRRA